MKCSTARGDQKRCTERLWSYPVAQCRVHDSCHVWVVPAYCALTPTGIVLWRGGSV